MMSAEVGGGGYPKTRHVIKEALHEILSAFANKVGGGLKTISIFADVICISEWYLAVAPSAFRMTI